MPMRSLHGQESDRDGLIACRRGESLRSARLLVSVCQRTERTSVALERPPLWSENQLCTFVCPLRLCLDHAFTLHNMIAQQYTTSGHFEHLFLPVSNR